MYTLVIADDENIEVKALRLLVGKELPEIEVVGVAYNSAELIALVQQKKPDIAIVDVNMPGINGIDAIDMLRAHGSTTHFIVHTAYDEFSYVQRGIALKVDAYILKPQKREVTVKTLREVCANIESSRIQKESVAQIYQLMEQVQPVLENEILLSIFIGEPEAENFEVYCTMHGLAFYAGVMVSVVPAGTKESFGAVKAQLRACVQEALGGMATALSSVMDSSISLLLFVPQGVEAAERTTWAQDVVSVLLKKVEAAGGVKARAGISPACEDFKRMFLAYKQSMEALKQSEAEIAVYTADAKEGHTQSKPAQSAPTTENQYVRRAQSYVQENYAGEISLEIVAESIGISPFYLSRLFKQETQSTFVEYLTQVRMEKALNLVRTTRMTISEISEQVGYLNPTYFCRIFKKYTGLTIGEIRDRNQPKQY